jgi:hypothetical protein
MRNTARRRLSTSFTVRVTDSVSAVKTSRRTIGFKPKKHGYLRLSVHRPHKHRAPVFYDLAKGVPSADGAGLRRLQPALTTCSYHSPAGCIYAVWEERMSESPASMMAMVEQRKSLPQAVPSSICITGKIQVSQSGPSKDSCVFAERASSQGSRVSMSSRAVIKAPSRDMRFFLLSQSGVERTLLPVKWWTAVLPSME